MNTITASEVQAFIAQLTATRTAAFNADDGDAYLAADAALEAACEALATKAVARSSRSGEVDHLIEDGVTLCGRTVTVHLGSYDFQPQHANCKRCIAKNGGATTWPEMQAEMDAAAAETEAAVTEAEAAEAEARISFEAAQDAYNEVARATDRARRRRFAASKVARNRRWAL